jgi:serine/threonine-protein kinase
VPEPSRQAPPSPDEIRAGLAKLLSSTLFVSAHRQSRFLRFVVERYIEGSLDRIREAVIGREVFDRGADYDPTIDPIVRVEATRLRSKLQQYYRMEGRNAPIVILMKKGSYVPVVRRRKKAPRRRDVKEQAPTIAVLPFHNLSGDAAQDFLCEGIAEELIHALSNFEGIRVISWNSTRKLKSAVFDLRFVAEQLKAGVVVEGSVRSVDSGVCVAAQVVETVGFCCLWSELYDCGAMDVTKLRDEIARAIVSALPVGGAVRTGQSKGPPRAPERPEVHKLYLKGKYHLNRRTAESLGKAVDCFEKLIEAGPDHARGHAGLAQALVLRAWYGYVAPDQVMPRAKAAALRAVKADSRSAEAHIALGLVKELYDWDWARARHALRLAIDLEPGNATALFEYGFFLSRMGELDDAFAIMRRALELDPLSPAINTNLGVNYYYQRNFGQAIRQYQEALELDPGYQPAHYRLALACLHCGLIEEARRYLEIGLRLPGARPLLLALSGYAMARGGRKDRTRAVLEALLASSTDRYVSPVSIAILFLGMNESGQCLDWLENARREHDMLLVDLKIDPLFDPLRANPAFRRLLERMHLDVPAG